MGVCVCVEMGVVELRSVLYKLLAGRKFEVFRGRINFLKLIITTFFL